jgi:hypothetical protein
VRPPLESINPDSPEFRVIRRLFGNQIRRAAEFANLAENGPLARAELFEVASALGLIAEWGIER